MRLLIFFNSISVISGFFFIFQTAYCQHPEVQWASEVIDFSSQYSDTKWTAQQVLGKPNAMPQGGKSACAWVPDNTEKDVWIKVRFEKPMKICQVTVAENYNPGSIYGIIAYDSTLNTSIIVYDQKALSLKGSKGMLHAFFPMTNFDIGAIELLMDGKTYKEKIFIDAIGISNSKKPIKVAINLPKYLKNEFILNTFFGSKNVLYKPGNLGNDINTKFLEDYPVISSDGKTLFFARANCSENTGGIKDNNDIYYSTLKDDGTWTNAINIGSPINNNYNNFVCSVSPNGNSLLLISKYYEAGKKNQGVFIAKRNNNKWDIPQKQTIRNFTNFKINAEFELSDDGKYLLMSLEKDGGYGERDLYVSFKEGEVPSSVVGEAGKSDGKVLPSGGFRGDIWSKPLNLGSIVNTASDDNSPFLATDGVSLYFSSKGFSGYGGYDLYKTIRLDDTWLNWSEPQNQGPEINSARDESCLTIPWSGDKAYFTSNKVKTGHDTIFVEKGDIYEIKLSEALKPYFVFSVSGNATNVLTKEPLVTEVMLICLDNNEVFGTTITSSEDGSYSFTWIYDKYCNNYTLLPTDSTLFIGELNFSISLEDEIKNITLDLPFLTLSGKAINVETNEPVQTNVRLICLDNGMTVGIATTDIVDGSYNFKLLVSSDCYKYSLLATDTVLFPISVNFDVKQIVESYKLANDNTKLKIKELKFEKLLSSYIKKIDIINESNFIADQKYMIDGVNIGIFDKGKFKFVNLSADMINKIGLIDQSKITADKKYIEGGITIGEFDENQIFTFKNLTHDEIVKLSLIKGSNITAEGKYILDGTVIGRYDEKGVFSFVTLTPDEISKLELIEDTVFVELLKKITGDIVIASENIYLNYRPLNKTFDLLIDGINIGIFDKGKFKFINLSAEMINKIGLIDPSKITADKKYIEGGITIGEFDENQIFTFKNLTHDEIVKLSLIKGSNITAEGKYILDGTVIGRYDEKGVFSFVTLTPDEISKLELIEDTVFVALLKKITGDVEIASENIYLNYRPLDKTFDLLINGINIGIFDKGKFKFVNLSAELINKIGLIDPSKITADKKYIEGGITIGEFDENQIFTFRNLTHDEIVKLSLIKGSNITAEGKYILDGTVIGRYDEKGVFSFVTLTPNEISKLELIEDTVFVALLKKITGDVEIAAKETKIPPEKAVIASSDKSGQKVKERSNPLDRTFDLLLVPIKEKQTIRLNSIFFELGKSALQDESLPELNRMVKFIKDRPSMQIEIAGHTDNIGSHHSNMKLSHNRSKAVTDFFIQSGVKHKRLHVKGYGETKPVTSNSTKKGRQLNRRVEFTILKIK